jgi:hypothetical protein
VNPAARAQDVDDRRADSRRKKLTSEPVGVHDRDRIAEPQPNRATASRWSGSGEGTVTTEDTERHRDSQRKAEKKELAAEIFASGEENRD